MSTFKGDLTLEQEDSEVLLKRNKRLKYLIQKFNLKPHFENGYLQDFFDHPNYTWCYYLLCDGERNPLHWLTCDESWQYCEGDPVDLFMVGLDGHPIKITIGPDIEKGHTYVHLIPKHTWFCAEVQVKEGYTLLTHWVTPRWTEVRLEKGYSDICNLFVKDKEFLERFCWENCRDD